MEFKNEVFSKVLTIVDYKSKFEEVINILDKHNYIEVEILFGVGWGHTYKNWTPFKVHLGQIAREIELAEELKEGVFGDDDFFILMNEMEILFCHERDIHLRFNHENKIVTEILKSWKADNLINTN